MNDVLFILKQAIGHVLIILCGVAVGIGMCKMCECIYGLFEIFRKRGRGRQYHYDKALSKNKDDKSISLGK